MNTCKLNKEQLSAIKHNKGPLLIIAGAGTGKTTVITEKIKYLITKNLAKPEEILALTFTEKAASEMEERIDKVMPLSYGDIWVMTFHSFCDRVLRENGLHIGLPSNFKLMTKEKSIDFFRRNLFEFSLDYFRPLGNPNKFIEAILSHFSRLQDEIVNPVEYLDWVNSKQIKNSNIRNPNEELEHKKWEELATVYQEYDKLKLKEAKFDFGDLIIKTVELFQKRPNILKKYQEKFKYILVDEYQDTNYAQNELVNLLVNKEKNLTVVGDDNQAIYRWRGAAISNILQFKKTYPEAKTVTLNKNYRSTQKILDSAYKLIKNNNPDTLEVRLGVSKKLISETNYKKIEPEFIFSNKDSEEAECVSNSINQLINLPAGEAGNSKYKYSDISILVRANNHADIFVREFERRGIPYQFLGPSKLLERREIVDLISYLRSLYDPFDSESFYRFLSSDIFEIDKYELIKAASVSKKKSVSIFEVVKNEEKFKVPMKIFINHLKEIDKKSAGEILYEYVEKINLYQKLLQNQDDVKAKNIAAFFNKIKSFENELPAGKGTLIFRQVVDYINLLLEVGESPLVNEGNWQENNAVNILTVHSAKGLEFPIVFLVNLVNERFPTRNRGEDLPIPDELIKEDLPVGDFHLQEERRLFYVGMTRAKEKLFLTASEFYGDAKRQKKISVFVYEALGEDAIAKKITVHSVDKNIFDLGKKEKPSESTKQKIEISYLSVSQIETFKICPLHYKLKYIYNFPVSPTASISFGISIHETLKNYYKQGGDILKIYEENWIDEGYLNKKHKEEYFKKGKECLTSFLQKGFDKKTETIALEEKFVIKINSGLKVGGVIDRIDKLSKGEYEIIDYKTGSNIPKQKEVDKDLQLSVYAMAASYKYNIDPKNIKLSLYFLDTQEKITTKRTKKDLEKVKKEILDIKEEIENSDFKCSNSYFCQQGCEFSMFCKGGNQII